MILTEMFLVILMLTFCSPFLSISMRQGDYRTTWRHCRIRAEAYVMDGDQELRQGQAAIAKGDADPYRPDLQTSTKTPSNRFPAAGACGSTSRATGLQRSA
jgi:hypothetical protein